MRTFKPTRGPFRQGYYFEISEIDNICVDALLDNDSLPQEPGPIDIELFLERRFGQILVYDELPDGCLGCTVFEKSGKVRSIIVNRSLSDGSTLGDLRVRSTWAHEAGHALLHAPLFLDEGDGTQSLPNIDVSVEADRFLCRESDIQPGVSQNSYDGRWWEWQANRCIGGLLLPCSLLKKALGELLIETPVTKLVNLPEENRDDAESLLAEKFEVSATVARIRLEEIFPPSNDQQLSF